jgi:hypothetical protein
VVMNTLDDRINVYFVSKLLINYLAVFVARERKDFLSDEKRINPFCSKSFKMDMISSGGVCNLSVIRLICCNSSTAERYTSFFKALSA